jgi:glutamate racemase
VTEQVAARYLEPLVAGGMDTLVLGCTHYPLLRPVLRRLLAPGVALVDSAESTAATVAAGLAAAGLERRKGGHPEHHFCVTDAADRFAGIARRILGDGDPSLELVEVV